MADRIPAAPSGLRRTLSDAASKELLAGYGVPFARERLAADAGQAAAAAIGFPVALKLCGEGIAHKTERDLVRLGLPDAGAVRAHYARLATAHSRLWGSGAPRGSRRLRPTTACGRGCHAIVA